jgi:hypothetical protein
MVVRHGVYQVGHTRALAVQYTLLDIWGSLVVMNLYVWCDK